MEVNVGDIVICKILRGFNMEGESDLRPGIIIEKLKKTVRC